MKSANKFVVTLLFLSIASGAFSAHRNSHCSKPRAAYCALMSSVVMVTLATLHFGPIASETTVVPREEKLSRLSVDVMSGKVSEALQANSSSIREIVYSYGLGDDEADDLTKIQERATRDGSLDRVLFEHALQKYILMIQTCEQLQNALKAAHLLKEKAIKYRENESTMTPTQRQKAQASFRHIKANYLRSMSNFRGSIAAQQTTDGCHASTVADLISMVADATKLMFS